MTEQATYKFHVSMSCSGCSRAITKTLEKAKVSDEIDDYKVSLKGQSATVTATKSEDDVKAIVAKPGKPTESWHIWAAENEENAKLAKTYEEAEAQEAAEVAKE